MTDTELSLQKHRTAEQRLAEKRDLTTGNIHRNIWTLAVPMILEMATLSVTQIVDTYWVGKLGSAALAAVTISMTLRWVINSLSNGLGIGGMAVVARRIGARDRAQADHATWQAILLAAFVSLVLGAVGILLAEPALRVLGADAEVLAMGVSFLRIVFGGLFTLVLVFVINSLLRGAGEAGLALAVLVLSQGLTVVLEPLLIFGWGPFPALGVDGSAWAGVLGFGAGALFQIAILLSGRARIAIHLHNLWPDLPLMWRIVKIALPSTIQMTLRSTSRLIILAIVGLYGTLAMAGFGVANRILLVALIPGFGLGNAAATLVGQNLGAVQPQRAERSAWWVTAYNASMLAAFAVVFFTFARPLVAFFDPTPEVADLGAEYLRIVAPSLILSAVGVVLARAFDGAGNTVPAMFVNLLTLWGMEAPLSYGLAQGTALGITGVWVGRALANLANGLLFAFWFRLGRWKRKEV
ncbi:MAG: MATE family efflux transporter [Anaerolineales bacterium]|nr:MAG: MATE family efflux transporter [Anaerolineales bacterium]